MLKGETMKKKIISIVSIVLSLTMILTMTACGNSGDKYLAVTEPTFPPFDTTDESGKIVGFDMDLMDAIASNQGFEVEYQAMNFDSLIPSIEAGNADIITAGMNADDPERQKKVDFSERYYKSGLVVMVKEDNNTIRGFSDLAKNMKVASQTGTTGASEAQELKATGRIDAAVILDEFNACIQQVVNGDVDAVIIDKPVAEAFVKKQEGKVKIVGTALNAESYGFAVRKGNNELLTKINNGLDNIKKNGKYDEIYAKWFE